MNPVRNRDRNHETLSSFKSVLHYRYQSTVKREADRDLFHTG